MGILFKARGFFISSPQCVRDWSGILCERISGTRFGNGNEVTELVEVPRSDSVARRRQSEQRYSGKPDAKRNAQISCQLSAISWQLSVSEFLVQNQKAALGKMQPFLIKT